MTPHPFSAVLALVSAVILAGCVASAPKKVVSLQTAFNADEVAWFQTKGTATISGNALLLTQGGVPRTCAGREVTLFPAGAYAKERMQGFYGSTTQGFIGAYSQQVEMENNPAYLAVGATAICDSQGNFEFKQLPAGEYFLTTLVLWRVNYQWQGGRLMQGFKLREGENKKIVMTQPQG